MADMLLTVETSPFQKLFSPEQALSWCKDICAGLNYIHTLPAPVIHRDLKLDNVLLADQGDDPAGRGVKRNAKIADFGLGAVRASRPRPVPQRISLRKPAAQTYSNPHAVHGAADINIPHSVHSVLPVQQCATGTAGEGAAAAVGRGDAVVGGVSLWVSRGDVGCSLNGG